MPRLFGRTIALDTTHSDPGWKLSLGAGIIAVEQGSEAARHQVLSEPGIRIVAVDGRTTSNCFNVEAEIARFREQRLPGDRSLPPPYLHVFITRCLQAFSASPLSDRLEKQLDDDDHE